MVYPIIHGDWLMYTVKQLSDLAGVSIRTLHYYHQIGLLTPDEVGQNGYRYYGEAALLRLQQILFFKELDLKLEQVQSILRSPRFDRLNALQTHKTVLKARVGRLEHLIRTIDKTILYLEGSLDMKQKDIFDGFNDEKQKEYQQKARQLYGEKAVRESEDRWNTYSPEKKAAIKMEGDAIFTAIRDAMPTGYDSPIVQEQVQNLHRYMGYFYECSIERFEGLGHLYNQSPEFIEMYQTKYDPEMPAFLEKALVYYCERLKEL
jgi:MerR family transcriptional regulator, thiopeptide resistance regulator